MNTPINIPITQCVSFPTILQENIYNYNLLTAPYINNWIAEAKSKELFGKSALKEYNKINNFYYLLNYILLVNEQRQIDLNNGIENDNTIYCDKFICIIDYYKCLGIDITPMLTIFNLSCNGALNQSGIGQAAVNDDSGTQPAGTVFTVS